MEDFIKLITKEQRTEAETLSHQILDSENQHEELQKQFSESQATQEEKFDQDYITEQKPDEIETNLSPKKQIPIKEEVHVIQETGAKDPTSVKSTSLNALVEFPSISIHIVRENFTLTCLKTEKIRFKVEMDYGKRAREYFFSVNSFSIVSDTGYNYLHILPLYSVPKKPENSTEVGQDLR